MPLGAFRLVQPSYSEPCLFDYYFNKFMYISLMEGRGELLSIFREEKVMFKKMFLVFGFLFLVRSIIGYMFYKDGGLEYWFSTHAEGTKFPVLLEIWINLLFKTIVV